MKSRKILIVILILIATLVIGTIKVQAASAEIYASKTTVEVGDEVTITAKFKAAAWNVKVSGNGISGASYASQTSDLSETENVKTFKLDTSKVGEYTISITGDITDDNGDTKEINQKCKVTVNEKKVTPKPEPQPQPEPEPETPKVEEKPNFTDTNKTMYAKKGINLRESWSTGSKATYIDKGTELTVTGTSSNKVNGYVWYRVSYNGQTKYVASYLLSDTKPEEPKEEPVEEPTNEERAEEPTDEPTAVDENNNEKSGLTSLEIEGLTLTPAFDPEVYEYRVIVKEDLSELKINAAPATEGAKITIAGNENLQEGENLIIIMVYNAQEEVEATYQITTNKSTLDLTETDNILIAGTKQATRNFLIFVILLSVSTIALVIIMALQHKTEKQKEDINMPEEQEKSTDGEQTVENATEKELKNENIDEKREKRKGKHF